MVVIKIRGQIPAKSVHSKQSLISTADELRQEKRIVSVVDSSDDADSFRLEEAGCEFCMVGDQICSIPHELYDLPDLREILSLETWNSCLTEEERYFLSAYLPDMDQHVFWLTMKELLGGKNMFFGSPLTELFEGLKGGLYPPKVTHFREGLQFLQRRAFYYSLISYHENLSQTISNMKKVWRECQPSTSVEERVHIWNTCKNQKPRDCVDLNVPPADEDTSTDDDGEATGHVAKKIKIPAGNGMTFVHPNASAKGVLKIKPGGLNSMQTSLACPRPPKGVLKIIPRGHVTQVQQSSAISTHQELTASTDISGLSQPVHRFSPLPQSMGQWDANYNRELHFLHQNVRDRITCETSELPNSVIDRHRVEYTNCTATGPSKTFQSSIIRKIRQAKDLRFDGVAEVWEPNSFQKNFQTIRRYSRENTEIRKDLTSENHWHNMGPQETDYHQLDAGERQMTPIYPKTSDVVSKVSGAATGGHQELMPASLDQSMGISRDVNDEDSHKPYDKLAILAGPRDGAMLPITYKRRKAQTKANPLGLVKTLTVEERNHHVGENVKAIKIKFKNQKDHTAIHRQGVLNWLQHGSPSA